jgi:hypothetical protein
MDLLFQFAFGSSSQMHLGMANRTLHLFADRFSVLRASNVFIIGFPSYFVQGWVTIAWTDSLARPVDASS